MFATPFAPAAHAPAERNEGRARSTRSASSKVRLVRVLTLAACVLTLGASFAEAGDRRPVVLPLDGGDTLEGVVESISDKEVHLRTGPESVRPIPLGRLAPLGLFRARQALAPPADGEARLELAHLAMDMGLHVEARIEFEKALALGAMDEETFAAALAQAERTAVEVGMAAARHQAEAGDCEGALEIARRLRLEFADAASAGEVETLVKDLLARIEEIEAEAARERAALEKVQRGVHRKKEIFSRQTKAMDLMREGKHHADLSTAARTQGSVTRARKAAELADERYMEARRHLGRLRRVLDRESSERIEVLQALDKLDREQFALLFGMASFLFHEAGAISHAERYVARASYLDPVDPDLVELRDLILSRRIRYRLSDMTNARGTVSGGASR